jgi:5-(carboxyamino)imidazole ribonucleotide mutase|tara:strand:- start:1529 stop:1990 length:462 start_codon:yes stop_codon:yes gene_type:complete
MNKKVAIILGSENDKKFIESSFAYYDFFEIEYEVHVISAHRNPDAVAKFAKNAKNNNYCTLIGAAGMAAHLAGALKANSVLPVIGVPLPGGVSDGMDSLLSTVQMPKGVPVATMSIGKSGMINAAILSAEILGLFNEKISLKLIDFKNNGAKL